MAHPQPILSSGINVSDSISVPRIDCNHQFMPKIRAILSRDAGGQKGW